VSVAHQPLTLTQRRRRQLGWLAGGLGVLAAIALLVTATPTAAGWVVFGLAALAATLVEPLVALVLLPFAVALGSLVALQVHGINVGPTDLLVGALVLAFAVRWLPAHLSVISWSRARGEMRRLRSEPQRLAVFAALAAYLAVVCLSLLVATSRASSLKEIVKWSEVLAVVALTLWQMHSPHRVHLAAWTLIAAGLVEALIGYGQWAVASGDLGPGGASMRVFGTFAQPNPFAGYLNFALPLALALTLFAYDARERWVAGGASVLLLGAQTLANSRGGLLGLLAAVVVTAAIGWRRERLMAIVAAVGIPLGLVAWFTHLIPTRIETALVRQVRVGSIGDICQPNNANFSTVERLVHWIAGLRMFAAHPLLGVGAGNYNAAYPRYTPSLSCWPEGLGQAHNYYINVAAETGLLGVLTFLAVVAAVLWLGWAASHPAAETRRQRIAAAPWAVPSRALAIGLLAVLVAICVHNLTDDLFVHAMELQFAMCAGLLLAMRSQERAPA
jgi:O-antigen ligase